MQPPLGRDRLSALLDAAAGRRIAVIGDAMLDVYLRGDVDRISPEAPVPVVRVRERRMALGGAANVAQNVVALGARCDLACVVGADASARSLREMLIAIASKRGIPVVVDPKYRNFFAYRGATIFKPNRRELESALGATMDVEHPETLPALVQRLGVANLLLTLGERGMVLVGARGETVRVPTTAREVYDVVGAGDTVTAYLAVRLAAGATAAEAAVIANFAAGVKVGKLGGARVSRPDVGA